MNMANRKRWPARAHLKNTITTLARKGREAERKGAETKGKVRILAEKERKITKGKRNGGEGKNTIREERKEQG